MGNSNPSEKRPIHVHDAYRTSEIDIDRGMTLLFSSFSIILEIIKAKQILDKNPDNGQLHESLGHLYLQKVDL